MRFYLLCTGRIDVYNDAIDGDCRTAAAKLFQMGIVCGISCFTKLSDIVESEQCLDYVSCIL